MTEETQNNSSDLVERAKLEREALIKENERLEKNLKELRELEANRLLGSSAGGRIEPQPKEETAKEYADKVMKNQIKK